MGGGHRHRRPSARLSSGASEAASRTCRRTPCLLAGVHAQKGISTNELPATSHQPLLTPPPNLSSIFANGVENRNIPRILITPIDSKKAFIRLAKPWKPEEWKDEGKARFLDLRTLAWALLNRSLSLKRLCELLKTEHRKFDHQPTGTVSTEEIEYARQNGRCTVDALNSLKQEFDNLTMSGCFDSCYGSSC